MRLRRRIYRLIPVGADRRVGPVDRTFEERQE